MSMKERNEMLIAFEGWITRRQSDPFGSRGKDSQFRLHYTEQGSKLTLCGAQITYEGCCFTYASPATKSDYDERYMPRCKRCAAAAQKRSKPERNQ